MDQLAIEKLYENLLSSWNKQDAKGMASLFDKNGNAVGFDGSQMTGPAQIETEIAMVFANHKTASYVWKIEEIRFLKPEVALLRGMVGMIPPGKKEINPVTNAIQSLVAVSYSGTWKISLFQNTPAQYHGRPELVKKMTEELNRLIK